jgi:hypothetical protein
MLHPSGDALQLSPSLFWMKFNSLMVSSVTLPTKAAAPAPGTSPQRMYARALNGSPHAGGEYSAAYRGGRNVGAGEDFPLVAGSPICDVEFVLIHATG